MKFTLFGITFEANRRDALTRDNVERLAKTYDSYSRHSTSHLIPRIKAARALNKEMSLRDAKEWVEDNFVD